MYSIKVCPLTSVIAHPQADRLNIARASGHTVVVGRDTKDGDLGLFFPVDGQLSHEFAEKYNLVKKLDENKKNVGGFFEANRKVRPIGLRGVKTEGFWLSLDTIEDKSLAELVEQDLVEDESGWIVVNDMKIARKFITEATRQAMSSSKEGSKKEKGEVGALKMHYETPKLKDNLRILNSEMHTGQKVKVIVTEKLHGTSHRVGNVVIENEDTRKWYEKVRDWLLRKPFKGSSRKVVNGSRRVILRENTSGFHGSNDFRFETSARFQDLLEEDECVYGEIVGWSDNQRQIMPSQDMSKIKQKGSATYHYGCAQGEHDFFVYRITKKGMELDWRQVVQRCQELGLKTVPVLYENFGPFQSINYTEYDNMELVEINMNTLACHHVRIDGPSVFPDTKVKEGVVVRLEFDHLKEPKVYKIKSFDFGVLEGYLKADDSYVDTEEAA